MGYPVSRSYGALDLKANTNDIYVLINPSYTYFADEEFDDALDWVYKGGRLIYLESAEYSTADYRLSLRVDNPGINANGYTLYSYGLGEIITGSADPLLNKALMENSSTGIDFTLLLDRWNIPNLYFSESIHGYLNTGNAWYRTPEILKIFVYQLAVIVALVIWHFGKRFGKPVPYFEETEREENEHIKALANIYNKSGATGVVLSNYNRRFIEHCARAFHVSADYAHYNLQALWRGASLPQPDLPAGILSQSAEKLTARQLKHHIKNIQTCEKVLRLKGDQYAGRLHTVSDTAH